MAKAYFANMVTMYETCGATDSDGLKMNGALSSSPAVNPLGTLAEQSQTLRLESLDRARHSWRKLVSNFPHASIYHDDAWLALVSKVYGFELWLASLDDGDDIKAGCVFARVKNPLAPRMVSLPFSDCCAPLGDRQGTEALLENIARRHFTRRMAWQVRGVAAPAPWTVVDRFQYWTLDLARSLAAIERNLHGSFRRAARRGGAERVRIECGANLSFLRRFYAMHLETRRRLGVPVQPLRFFKLIQRTFAPLGAFEVWIASAAGSDVAGLILLRHRDRLYYRWGARKAVASGNANHVLVWNVVEEYAGKVGTLDLGRTDIRNQGLIRFKSDLGASFNALPYSFLPRAPRNISSESTEGWRKSMQAVWRHMPLPATRIIGSALYRLFA